MTHVHEVGMLCVWFFPCFPFEVLMYGSAPASFDGFLHLVQFSIQSTCLSVNSEFHEGLQMMSEGRRSKRMASSSLVAVRI